MDYVINGKRKLNGEISVYGSKNCALALLGASVLTNQTIILNNCPQIDDVENMLLLLSSMGKRVLRQNQTICISGHLTTTSVPNQYATKLRGSALLLGSVVAKYGSVYLPLPGGCAIGSRPMDIHLSGLQKMSLEVVQKQDSICCFGKPKGCTYFLPFASVGATENLLCASVFAKGTTILYNCAVEPEVVALEQMLVQMGAKISGVGTSVLLIEGVPSLTGVIFDVIADRIVAATYLSAALASGGNVLVKNCVPSHLQSFLNIFAEQDCVKIYKKAILVHADKKLGALGKIVTAPFPGFATDMQSLILSVACCCSGTTIVQEKLFENRLAYQCQQLCKMDANVVVKGDCATVEGTSLRGAKVQAGDLRGGAGLVIAGLAAEGQTVVSDVHHVSRGYYNLHSCFQELGADICLTK